MGTVPVERVLLAIGSSLITLTKSVVVGVSVSGSREIAVLSASMGTMASAGGSSTPFSFLGFVIAPKKDRDNDDIKDNGMSSQVGHAFNPP